MMEVKEVLWEKVYKVLLLLYIIIYTTYFLLTPSPSTLHLYFGEYPTEISISILHVV
jgi:hypothetical protein